LAEHAGIVVATAVDAYTVAPIVKKRCHLCTSFSPSLPTLATAAPSHAA
jgi:hypothetical protein